MSQNRERAFKELQLAGWFKKDSLYGGEIGKALIELFKTFEKINPPISVYAIIANLFGHLLKGLPLTELKGTPEEWDQVEDIEKNIEYQNNRCPFIFAKDDNGTEAKMVEAIIFENKEKKTFYSPKFSSIPISFPCFPPHKVLIKEGTPEAEPFKEVFEK